MYKLICKATPDITIARTYLISQQQTVIKQTVCKHNFRADLEKFL
jgi:hypothetical protein